jgi:hypothetical protein
MVMEEFDFEFLYIRGKAIGAADALSRKDPRQKFNLLGNLWRMDAWKATMPILISAV